MKDKKEEMSNFYEYNYQLHSTIIYITCATYFFFILHIVKRLEERIRHLSHGCREMLAGSVEC